MNLQECLVLKFQEYYDTTESRHIEFGLKYLYKVQLRKLVLSYVVDIIIDYILEGLY